MSRRRLVVLIIFVLLLTGLPSRAYFNPGRPTGFVNDYAGLLSAEEKSALENKLTVFNQESSNEISIVVIPSLEGDTIENFAVKLFEEWGIGKSKQDNGVLLLVALNDRQMRIEVGYGLEGTLPDAISYQIITKTLKPAFQAENYYEGISVATDQIMAATRGEYQPEATSGAISGGAEGFLKNLNGDAVTFLIFLLYALFSIARRRLAKTKRWWPGGVWGAVLGLIVALIFFRTLLYLIVLPASLFGFGLFFDYLVSRVWPQPKGPRGGRGGGFWFLGGGSGGSGGFGGGGFGGFGGGGSGGGGSSGSW